MKKMFKGYYSPNDEDIKLALNSPDVLVVFDTNVLLNLYSYEKQTRDDFFSLLESLGEKIWLPYHVCLEYHRRRLDVISAEKKIFRDISTSLKKMNGAVGSECSNIKGLGLKKRFLYLYDQISELETNIKSLIEGYEASVNEFNEKQPCIRSVDDILNRITSIFDEKCGSPYDQGKLDAIYKEGLERYQNKIPPGFEDQHKSSAIDSVFFYDSLSYERQYGDLILWKQIIDKASKNEVKKVIFITDDSKDDWWLIRESNGKKNISARPELVDEITKNASVDFFCICNTSGFLKIGQELFNKIKDESINEAQKLFIITWGKDQKDQKDQKNQKILDLFVGKLSEIYKDKDSDAYSFKNDNHNKIHGEVSKNKENIFIQRVLDKVHRDIVDEELSNSADDIFLSEVIKLREALKSKDFKEDVNNDQAWDLKKDKSDEW